jgi:UDP-N-acetyl-D-glucosamine dehydrogenase
MALVCHKLGINIWDVIEAAQTKPFGFMPFYPGPGLGGHCIPVDHHYLTWKARMNGVEPRLIELAGHINSEMPAFTIRRVTDALNERQKSLKGSRVLAVGVTYKRDASDLQESPALDVVRGLRVKGALVYYTDPYVPSLEIDGSTIESVKLAPKTIESMDCLVVLTDHSDFDYKMIANHSSLVVDSRNALKNFSGPHIVNL